MFTEPKSDIKARIKELSYYEGFRLRLDLLIKEATSNEYMVKLDDAMDSPKDIVLRTNHIESRISHVFNTLLNGISAALQSSELLKIGTVSGLDFEKNTLTKQQAKELMGILVKRIHHQFGEMGLIEMKKHLEDRWGEFLRSLDINDVDQFLNKSISDVE